MSIINLGKDKHGYLGVIKNGVMFRDGPRYLTKTNYDNNGKVTSREYKLCDQPWTVKSLTKKYCKALDQDSMVDLIEKDLK